MKKAKFAMLAVAVLVLGCGSFQPVLVTSTPQTDMLSTIVAQTMQAIPPTISQPAATVAATATLEAQPTALQVTPTAPPNEILVSVAGKSFTIPSGLATGARHVPVAANTDSNLPIWDVFPAHDEFELEGYTLPNKFFIPKFFFYPKDEFSVVNEGAAQIIADMQTILANQSAPLPEVLPFLPLFNAGQVFHSNEQFLTFQNGTGLRYLTQFSQAPTPVNNHEMFYTFQGLTNDGTFYIAAILPVNAAFLVENAEPETPTPAEGISFDWNNFDTLPTYYSAVKQKLSAADPNVFTPSLTSLDRMVESLTATGGQ
jgi:hypothetical protein